MLAEIPIPDMYSLRSVLSVGGMIYFLICLTIYGVQGPWKGMATNCVLLVIGLFIFSGGVADTKGNWEGALHTRFIGYEDVRHTRYVGTVSSDEYYWKESQYEDIFKDARDKEMIYWDEDNKILGMHDPSCDDYICSPWVFHPACLIYSN